MRYLPFGETRWAWGATPTDRRYTGQREVAGVGLYDYNARMYWPAAGRFLSADTVVPGPRSPQAFNRYMYVLGNPLRFTDPSGRYTEEQIRAYLAKTYGELADAYMEAWKRDTIFWSMLVEAGDEDILYAPTTSLGPGQFRTVGDSFEFSGPDLKSYQGVGPYRLVGRNGNDKIASPPLTAWQHKSDAALPVWEQPLFHYTDSGPVYSGWNRHVSYQPTGNFHFDLTAGDSAPVLFALPLEALTGSVAGYMVAIGLCPVCGAAVGGIIVAASIVSALDNAYTVEMQLSVDVIDTRVLMCPLSGCGHASDAMPSCYR